jgi:hypothetical protein
MERARKQAAAVALPAWEPEAVAAVVAAEGAVDNSVNSWKKNEGNSDMKTISANRNLNGILWILTGIRWAFPTAPALLTAQEPSVQSGVVSIGVPAKTFSTPQQAADALIRAAEKFDVGALEQILGPDGDDLIFTGEYAQDRQLASKFVAEAREKKSVSVDPKTSNRAFLLVGNEDWPFPLPLVKSGEKWIFDTKAGRQELIYRRIGSNELDAIEICHGYVEAQKEYALGRRDGYDVNQYAQRIVSTPGKQDGLAWQNADGSWGGPIGENIARAIEQGYSSSAEPYHGYFFKILKRQGSAAPLGELDYVVKGVMIGGFALVAAPAEYGITGVKSFMVSNEGVVYQKDLGPTTLDEFRNMERFNPDPSWNRVVEE